jgi:hypothetical protein
VVLFLCHKNATNLSEKNPKTTVNCRQLRGEPTMSKQPSQIIGLAEARVAKRLRYPAPPPYPAGGGATHNIESIGAGSGGANVRRIMDPDFDLDTILLEVMRKIG